MITVETVASGAHWHELKYKSHARLAGFTTTLCGQYQEPSRYTDPQGWSGGWLPVTGAPTCKCCLALLPQAYRIAADYRVPDPPDCEQSLLLVATSKQQRERGLGPLAFPGKRLLVGPEHTFCDLSLTLHELFEIGWYPEQRISEHEIYPPYREAHSGHAYLFELSGGRTVQMEGLELGRPDNLLHEADEPVVALVGGGEQFRWDWDLSMTSSVWLRAERERPTSDAWQALPFLVGADGKLTPLVPSATDPDAD